MPQKSSFLHDDRFFNPEPSQRRVAVDLYQSIANLPLVCPHTHVDACLFSDSSAHWGSPADLFIIPDHYVFRMLYSRGVPLESLGVPRLDGSAVETEHRKIWQVFADHFYLFRLTPSGAWLEHSLYYVFGVTEQLTSENAQAVYDQIATCLEQPSYRPRLLFEKFNIEVLCTTNPANDPLPHHRSILASGWKCHTSPSGAQVSAIRPTFRPDNLVNLSSPNWLDELRALEEVTSLEITSYKTFILALEKQRQVFKSLGATATDHAALTPYTAELSPLRLEAIFRRALGGQVERRDTQRFTGHMLMEMARMCVDDGLVMQLHPGSLRDHNQYIFRNFGPDKGADIPIQVDFTHNLRPLLNKYGNHPNFTLILFTLDESTFSRELAPLAGHYPAVRLGPPWWFFDSPYGVRRYLESVVETAGVYNTVGFNDDTRAFPSIPARHDLWRRLVSDWLASRVVRHVIDLASARSLAFDLAYRLAKEAYHLDN